MECLHATVGSFGARDELLFDELRDETCDLALVAAGVLHDLAGRGAFVARDVAEGTRLHHRDPRLVFRDRRLEHALEAMNHVVEQLQEGVVVDLVDRVNFSNHDWLMLSINRVRHPLKFRQIEVSEVRDLSPGMRSIVLAGDDLHDFVSASFDDHLKLMLPSAPGVPFEAPEMTPEGPKFKGPKPTLRDFTPRAYDNAARRLTIEFAIHAGGVASEWARSAKVGDRIAIGGPRGSTVVPLAYDWHVLIGDESALPAIARRLEELPAGAPAHVFVETTHEADRRELATAANARFTWLAASEDGLAEALRAFAKPTGEGFVWAAGEAASMRRVRAVLREVHDVTSSHSRVSAYWKRGVADHHEDLE